MPPHHTASAWEKTPFGSTSDAARPTGWPGQRDGRPASSASVAIRSDSTVQSIPTPICPFSKAARPRSRSSLASPAVRLGQGRLEGLAALFQIDCQEGDPPVRLGLPIGMDQGHHGHG